MKYRVEVELKKEILNPEARAVKESLQKKGLSHLKSLAISKNFIVELSDDCSDPVAELEKMAQSYLANPLSENYKISKLEA